MMLSEVFGHVHQYGEYVDQWVFPFQNRFHIITFEEKKKQLLQICLFFHSMVAGFLDAIAKVRQFKFHNDDDIYDRLSRRFSVVLLMLFTVVVSTKQYVVDPIACFAPAQFTGKDWMSSFFVYDRKFLYFLRLIFWHIDLVR